MIIPSTAAVNEIIALLDCFFLFSDQWCTQNLLGYSNVTVFSQRALWVGASCKNCHMAFKSLQFTFTTFSSSFHAVMNIILFKCSYVNNKVKYFPSFLFYLTAIWLLHGNPFTWATHSPDVNCSLWIPPQHHPEPSVLKPGLVPSEVYPWDIEILASCPAQPVLTHEERVPL